MKHKKENSRMFAVMSSGIKEDNIMAFSVVVGPMGIPVVIERLKMSIRPIFEENARSSAHDNRKTHSKQILMNFACQWCI
jgi:hypothetical protein